MRSASARGRVLRRSRARRFLVVSGIYILFLRANFWLVRFNVLSDGYHQSGVATEVPMVLAFILEIGCDI